MNKAIKTEKAPAPIGPYNQAILANNTLYMSGQIALHPESGEVVSKSIKEETHQVMKNVGAVLEEAGLSYVDLVKCTIFLSNMDDFPDVNEVYGSYFTGNYPSRETVEVSKLPKGVNVEISGIAIKN